MDAEAETGEWGGALVRAPKLPIPPPYLAVQARRATGRSLRTMSQGGYAQPNAQQELPLSPSPPHPPCKSPPPPATPHPPHAPRKSPPTRPPACLPAHSSPLTHATHPPTRLPTRLLLSPHAPQKYWYNESTGDTTWEQPIELAAGRAGMPDRDSLVTCAAASPPALPPLPALGLSDILPPEWEQHVDDTSGESYWHNTATGETTWEKPER